MAQRWLDEQQQRTWRAWLTVSEVVPRVLDAQLQRDAGITHAAYVVLAMLSEAPGRSRRMSDLARRANQSQSRLSHTVSRLEERGWVRRERSAEDGRGNLAVLTDAGWDVVRSVAPGHVGVPAVPDGDGAVAVGQGAGRTLAAGAAEVSRSAPPTGLPGR